MNGTPTISDPRQHVRSKRRWLVPVVLVALLLLVAGVLGGLAIFSPSSVTIEQAKAVCQRMCRQFSGYNDSWVFDTQSTRADLVAALGRPSSEGVSQDGLPWCRWRFTSQTLNSVEYFEIALVSRDTSSCSNMIKSEDTFTGRAAWEFRWESLKSRLGWK